jgi:hypothetical protein
VQNLKRLLLIILVLGTVAQARSAQHFSLVISARRATVKSGEPLIMQLIFTNKSKGELATEPWGDVFFELSVHDARGTPKAPKPEEKKQLPPGEFLVPQRGGPIHFLTREESTTVDFEVAQRFRYFLTEPGKYTFQAHRYDEQSKTDVKSNVITVTVTP